MNQAQEGYGEIFLVCQDDVIATVHVDEREAGWSVHVFEVQQPERKVVHFSRGFAVAGLLEKARRLGTEAALEQIAVVLDREAGVGGSVLRVVAREIPTSGKNYEAYVEAIDAEGQVSDHLLVTVAGRDRQTLLEAVDLGRTGLKRVVGVSPEGKILT